jgi:HPt (histidine-containing phosphotransfer) domain-containing protein
MNEADRDALPLLDPAIIAELREVMEEAFSELLGAFLADVPIQLERLRIAVEQASAADVYQIAHKLKSSCGSFGARQLTEIVERLEQAGRQGNLADAGVLLQRARRIAEETSTHLRALPG